MSADELFARMNGLLDRAAELPDPDARAMVRTVASAIMELHAAALARIVEALKAAGEPGRAVIDVIDRDDLVRNVLFLHGVHPTPLETRVAVALAAIDQGLARVGAKVELVSVSAAESRAELRLYGADGAAPPPHARAMIDDALFQLAPDLDVLDVHAGAFLPVARLFARREKEGDA